MELDRETIMSAKALQHKAVSTAKELSYSIAKVLADELEKMEPKTAKAVELVFYPVMCEAFTELWVENLNMLTKVVEVEPDEDLKRAMGLMANKERARMISKFMQDISEVCKEGFPK
jgi:hypothetical protein